MTLATIAPAVPFGTALALARYAGHLATCDVRMRSHTRRCTCGFSAALAAAFPDQAEAGRWLRAEAGGYPEPDRGLVTLNLPRSGTDPSGVDGPSDRDLAELEAGEAPDRKPSAWGKLMARVIERDGGICQICNEAGADGMSQVVPSSRGGKVRLENMRAAHRGCVRRVGEPRPPTAKCLGCGGPTGSSHRRCEGCRERFTAQLAADRLARQQAKATVPAQPAAPTACRDCRAVPALGGRMGRRCLYCYRRYKNAAMRKLAAEGRVHKEPSHIRTKRLVLDRDRRICRVCHLPGADSLMRLVPLGTEGYGAAENLAAVHKGCRKPPKRPRASQP